MPAHAAERPVGAAGTEVGEDLIDHGPLGDARDDPHGPEACWAREGVDLGDLLVEGRPPAGGLAGGES